MSSYKVHQDKTNIVEEKKEHFWSAVSPIHWREEAITQCGQTDRQTGRMDMRVVKKCSSTWVIVFLFFTFIARRSSNTTGCWGFGWTTISDHHVLRFSPPSHPATAGRWARNLTSVRMYLLVHVRQRLRFLRLVSET